MGRGWRHDSLRKRGEQDGYLTTEKAYENFVLRLKFKGEVEGNSGVFVHSKITGMDPEHGPDIEGMQVEVDPAKASTPAGCTKAADVVG